MTKTEEAIYDCLRCRKGRAVYYSEIAHEVFNAPSREVAEGYRVVIQSHIKALRRKLHAREKIVNIQGVGYRYEEEYAI